MTKSPLFEEGSTEDGFLLPCLNRGISFIHVDGSYTYTANRSITFCLRLSCRVVFHICCYLWLCSLVDYSCWMMHVVILYA